MTRTLDIIFSAFGLLLGSPILFVLWVMGFCDTGSPLFRQERVGKNRRLFVLVKFRTMRLDAPSVASHLSSVSAITSYGSFLRRTKLDELPQLWNVLKGDMSLVGPRPGLENQYELTTAREARRVYSVRPGITGRSQVLQIDMSNPEKLALSDAEMIKTMSVPNYFKYIFLTLAGKGGGDSIQ